MGLEKPSMWDRLKDGYEAAKKPIAYVVMLVAMLMETLPDVLPVSVREVTTATVLIILALILMEMLFEIYEKVVKDRKELNIIDSNELYSSILDIVLNERKVNIKYIGVAGRHGWNGVLEKLLNENNPDSLIANRTKFEIDVALLNPETRSTNERVYKRFEVVASIAGNVESAAKHVPKISESGSYVKLHYYGHMPNMLGFLINENYLFLTHAYWEHMRGELTLRAGGTNYFVYDKNDDFGGQEIIKRFQGWFEFILESDPTSTTINSPVAVED